MFCENDKISKLNFNRINYINIIVQPPVEIESRLQTYIEYNTSFDVDFNLCKIPISELSEALDLFKDATMTTDYNIYSFEQSFIDVCGKQIPKCLTKIILLYSISVYLKDTYNRPNYPLRGKIDYFMAICDKGLNKIDKLINKVKNTIEKFDRIKLNDMPEALKQFSDYIDLFHATDDMLLEAFSCYFYLKQSSNDLINTFDHFKYDLDNVYESHIKQNCLFFQKNYLTDDSIPDWEIDNKLDDIRTSILVLFSSLEQIITSVIDYKTMCFEKLENAKLNKKSCLSNTLLKGCYGYFSRFYDVHKIKLEMVNDIEVESSKEMRETHENPKYNCYENSKVPLILRDCHRHVISRKSDLEAPPIKKNKLSKTVLKAYKNTPNENVKHRTWSEINALYTEDAIKNYIKEHINEFFPKKFREKFLKLSQKMNSTAFNDNNNLLELFGNIDFDNQTKILFIFDHILCVSYNVHFCYSNRYELTDEYSKIMLDNENPSHRFKLLFGSLVDLYRTGQLLIPQFIIDTVRTLERHVISSRTRLYEDEDIQKEKKKVRGLIERYTEGEENIVSVFEKVSLKASHIMIKQILIDINYFLPDNVKERMLKSIHPIGNNMDQIVFVDSVLIEAFHFIPQQQRVLLNYLINHLARVVYADYIDEPEVDENNNDNKNMDTTELQKETKEQKFKEYKTKIANKFAPILFRFHSNVTHDQNFNIIMSKILERFIEFYNENKSNEFSVIKFSTNLLQPKNKINDLTSFMKPVLRNPDTMLLDVSFDDENGNEIIPYIGKRLSPGQALFQPNIGFEFNPKDYYTIMMIDPDLPINTTDKNDIIYCRVHWLLINLCQNDNNSKAKIQSPYASPLIDENLINHRYMILAYKQHSPGDFPNHLKIDEPDVRKREYIELKKFEIINGLELVAANYFYCEYRKMIPPLTHPIFNKNYKHRAEDFRKPNMSKRNIQVKIDHPKGSRRSITEDKKSSTPKKTTSAGQFLKKKFNL